MKKLIISKEELKVNIRSHFYSEENVLWEPYEDWDITEVENQCQDITRSIIILLENNGIKIK